MPKQEKGDKGQEEMESSTSSTSTPSEEQQQLPPGGSRKLEEKDKRQTGQTKRVLPIPGGASSGSAPGHLLKKEYHDRGEQSPAKLRKQLERANARECRCDLDEDSIHEPTCAFRDLTVDVEKDANAGEEPQPTSSARYSHQSGQSVAQSGPFTDPESSTSPFLKCLGRKSPNRSSPNCSCGDENHKPECSKSKKVSVGAKKAFGGARLKVKENEDFTQSSISSVPSVAEHPRSATASEQSTGMSLLKPPGTSAEVNPTSPKKKSVLETVFDSVKGIRRKLSPKRSATKQSSSDASPKGKSPVRNPSKSEASSSSSSPSSKKTIDSSFDSSLRSTGSSDTNVVESPCKTKNSPNTWKHKPGSSGVATGGRAQPEASGASPGMLNVPAVSERQRSVSGSGCPRRRSRSLSPRPECLCEKTGDKYSDHEEGCPVRAQRRRDQNNKSCINTYKHPPRYNDSDGAGKT